MISNFQCIRFLPDPLMTGIHCTHQILRYVNNYPTNITLNAFNSYPLNINSYQIIPKQKPIGIQLNRTKLYRILATGY